MIKSVSLLDKQANHIVYQYYLDHYHNHARALLEYQKLNTMLANSDTELVQSGNIVFLLIYTHTEAEFHSMGKATSVFAFSRSCQELINYVKTQGVSAVKTYGADPVFERIVSRMRADISTHTQLGPDGTTQSYYRLEF